MLNYVPALKTLWSPFSFQSLRLLESLNYLNNGTILVPVVSDDVITEIQPSLLHF